MQESILVTIKVVLSFLNNALFKLCRNPIQLQTTAQFIQNI